MSLPKHFVSWLIAGWLPAGPKTRNPPSSQSGMGWPLVGLPVLGRVPGSVLDSGQNKERQCSPALPLKSACSPYADLRIAIVLFFLMKTSQHGKNKQASVSHFLGTEPRPLTSYFFRFTSNWIKECRATTSEMNNIKSMTSIINKGLGR